MRFLLSTEQRDFASGLDALLAAADVPAATRARAAGDPAPFRALWRRLAAADVPALAVPERFGGTDLLPLELALACVELGRHAVPGPLAESFAASVLLDGTPQAAELLPRVVAGEAVLSLALPGHSPYAADPDLADAVLTVADGALRIASGHGPLRQSLDPARRLARPEHAGAVGPAPGLDADSLERATAVAVLCTAALALGTGRHLLAATVAYANTRVQFGTPIGGFQAVKHRLADVLLGLEFAEPLLYAAALGLADGGTTDGGPDLYAAKAACGEAGYAAARAALQLHGAIGYTDEFDLSLWIRRARVLRSAWGSPSDCRRRVLDAQKGTTGRLVR